MKKTHILITLTMALAVVLTGCATGAKVNNTVSVPSKVQFKVDKNIASLGQLVGQTYKFEKPIDKIDRKTGETTTTIPLKSTGFWDFLASYSSLYVLFWLFIVVGLITGVLKVLWKSPISLRGSFVLGLIGASGLILVAFVKLFWGWLVGLTILAVVGLAAFEIWKHRGELEDLTDDWKFNDSNVKKEAAQTPVVSQTSEQPVVPTPAQPTGGTQLGV